MTTFYFFLVFISLNALVNATSCVTPDYLFTSSTLSSSSSSWSSIGSVQSVSASLVNSPSVLTTTNGAKYLHLVAGSEQYAQITSSIDFFQSTGTDTTGATFVVIARLNSNSEWARFFSFTNNAGDEIDFYETNTQYGVEFRNTGTFLFGDLWDNVHSVSFGSFSVYVVRFLSSSASGSGTLTADVFINSISAKFSGTATTAATARTTTHNYLGSRGSDSFISADINLFAIYDSALTDAQIADIFTTLSGWDASTPPNLGCSVQGDPLFKGFNGAVYQVHGIPNSIYSLVTCPILQLNSHFDFFGSAPHSHSRHHRNPSQKFSHHLAHQAHRHRERDSDQSHYHHHQHQHRNGVNKRDRKSHTVRWTHPGTYMSELGIKYLSSSSSSSSSPSLSSSLSSSSSSGDVTTLLLTAGSYDDGIASILLNGVELEIRHEHHAAHGVVKYDANAEIVASNSSEPSSSSSSLFMFTIINRFKVKLDVPPFTFTFVNSDYFFNIESASFDSELSLCNSTEIDGLLGWSVRAPDRRFSVKSSLSDDEIEKYRIASDQDISSDQFLANQFTSKPK